MRLPITASRRRSPILLDGRPRRYSPWMHPPQLPHLTRHLSHRASELGLTCSHYGSKMLVRLAILSGRMVTVAISGKSEVSALDHWDDVY